MKPYKPYTTRLKIAILFSCALLFCHRQLFAQTTVTPSFTIPDTVCLGTPVTITNTTVGASSYYWNFCTADINAAPIPKNLGNFGGDISSPVYMDIAVDKGHYYAFVINYVKSSLIRLDFGNSFLNTPTSTNLGDFGGILPQGTTEGIQVVNNENKWYAIVVGGTPAGGTKSTILKISFGNSLSNNSPTATDWGNIGNLDFPHDLHVFKEKSNWYGFTVNKNNNTITRFDFTNSFENIPTGKNLGNLGNLNLPTGLYAISDNGNWHVFITNSYDEGIPTTAGTLTRLDFGSSLLNMPTAVNLGNIGNTLHTPRDISIINLCSGPVGFVVNHFTHEVVRLNFNNGLNNPPVGTSLGDLGNFDFAVSISKLFREGADVYSFVPDVNSQTITRLKFAGCTNANIPNSTAKNPPPITYSTPGVYNINLTVDDGLATQSSICKQLFVSDCKTNVTPSFTVPDTVCVGSPITIKNTTIGASSYYWNFCTADINAAPQGDNLGNIGGVFSAPVFADIVSDNGKFYAFVTNYASGSLVRLDFGNNMLNKPTATFLGSFGGQLPVASTEGIQVVKNEGKWYAIIVGGGPEAGTSPKVVKLSFGASITNNNPILTDWGNIDNKLGFPHDFQLFKDGNNWFGFTINKQGNTLTRIDFTNSFENIPKATNIINPPSSNLNLATGFFVINDAGQWHIFVVNSYDEGFNPPDDGTITRFDFGTSLLNTTPAAVNITNSQLGGTLHNPRDIYVIKYCGDLVGFVVNHKTNDIVKLNFNDNILSIPTATSLGNIGGMNFPHSISKLFRVGADLYTFIPNAANNTITRLKFAGCTDASTPSSTAKNPPPVTYSTPGVYNINLTVDEGLATQSSLCKQVYVKDCTIPVIPSFIVPDTICAGELITIKNTTKGATNYFWNFCTADISAAPKADNIGNPGNLNGPVFSDFVQYNGKYYMFVVDNFSNSLTRLDYGTSLLNKPTSVDLGNFGGVFPVNPEGIQVVNVNGKWYAIVVGGDPQGANTPKIVKISFGTSPANASPAITDWGNQGNMSYPHDLYVFSDGIKWYGFTVNARNSTITRFDFGTDFSNPPAGTNLGNFNGLINTAVGINAVQYNGNWYAFVTNAADSKLIRLDFGNNLLNNPKATDIGNPGNTLNNPRDIYIIKYCGDIVGFTVNAGNNDVVRLDFNGDVTAIPAATSLGNIGNLNFPHSLSKLFRVGADVYTFITNVGNNTITRLKFEGCTNSSIPNSSAQDPPAISYAVPGVYNINLTIDDGLSTQGSLCKQVYVKDCNTICNVNPDFSFNQDVCNPKFLQFNNETQNVSSVSWDFGNGQKAGNDLTPAVTYNAYGNYNVKLTVKTTSGCVDTVTKNISVNIKNDSLIITNDTLLCNPQDLQLKALPALSYCWSPAKGLSATDIANPVAKITGNITYYLTTKSTGKNLIVNGDFSQGNTGFTSGYVYTPANNTTEGQYNVGTNSGVWNPAMASCTDHTGNNGNMMMINGNTQPNLQVWAQTIAVKPNTTYSFSAWLEPLHSQNPAALQFYINGKTIGNVFNAALPTCNWQQFYITWNSGDTNKATISIINKNTIVQGNDFALDDISFAESIIKTDSVAIKLNVPQIKLSPDTTICAGGSVQIAANVPGSAIYKWTPSAGINNTGIANPVASPANTTTYRVDATNIYGCKITDSVKVTVLPQPVVKTIADTAICEGTAIQLNTASNGSTYHWSPSAGLSDVTQQSPLAKPQKSTQYIVTVNPGTQCTINDTVNIAVNQSPALQVSGDTTICSGTSVQLTAASSGSVQYNWLPGASLNNTAISNPVATPAATTRYFVQVKGLNGCLSSDSVTVSVLPQPSVKTIADTAICNGATIQLTTNTVNGSSYSWYPVTGLSGASQQSPVAQPAISTQYIITVNAGSLCTAKDTVNIAVKPAPTVKLPNDTTLCNGTSTQIIASSPDAVSYTWLPAAGLSDASASNPVASPQTTTNYVLQVTGSNGCNNKDSILITVLPQPTVTTIADTAVCLGAPVTLITSATNGNSYSWSPVTGLSSPSAQSPTASPVKQTQYIVTVNQGTLCTAQDTVNITVNPLPVVQAYGDTTLCIGASVQLTAASGNNVTYSWSPSTGLNNPAVNNPVASPTSPTVYTVQAVDGNKCAAQASVTVNVIPQPNFSISPVEKQICTGDPLTLTATGGDTYQWGPAETVVTPTAASTQVKPLSNTTYQVIITNNACKVVDTLYSSIVVTNKFTTSITKSNDLDCVQSSATLQATGGNQYSWSPATNINQTNIPNPVVSPLETTTYYVVIKKNGCEVTDSITVVVTPANADNAYKMPNAFTPNGDGVNDCFGVKYWGGIKTFVFEVYNRWGNRVFYTNDPSKCWDGTYKGQYQPGGTYVYQIKAETICGSIYKKGTVVIIR